MDEYTWVLESLFLFGPLLTIFLTAGLSIWIEGLATPPAWILGACFLIYILGVRGYCSANGVRIRFHRPMFFVPVDMSPSRRNWYSTICFLFGFSAVSWFALI